MYFQRQFSTGKVNFDATDLYALVSAYGQKTFLIALNTSQNIFLRGSDIFRTYLIKNIAGLAVKGQAKRFMKKLKTCANITSFQFF